MAIPRNVDSIKLKPLVKAAQFYVIVWNTTSFFVFRDGFMGIGGCLYVVATPIGNLDDISQRAITILKSVDIIAAEDTRHSGKLLQHLGIDTPMIAYHDHNETSCSEKILQKIADGEQVALISDAGTPLISDPGYKLIHQARERKLSITPIPGPCALIAALSVSGLATDKFIFDGFLPAKPKARLDRLVQLSVDTRTQVFYESPHRLLATLEALLDSHGPDRHAVVAREISKAFETVYSGSVSKLLQDHENGLLKIKGEIVLLLSGAPEMGSQTDIDENALNTLDVLLSELPLKQASALASKITGYKKNQLYQEALKRIEKP